MAKSAVKVIETKSRPAKLESYSMIMRGLRTREAAEQWGARYGFSLVYWIKAEEKVYGVKTIADDAQAIEKKSKATLNQMEMPL